MRIQEAYPQVAGLITQADIQAAQRFYHDNSAEKLNSWAEERITGLELGGRVFRFLLDRPHDEAAESGLVLVTSEYANGWRKNSTALARARITRDMIDPKATLVMQINTARAGEDNSNFSKDERKKLHAGVIQPMTDRLLSMLEFAARGSLDDTTITAFGSSQGATVVNSLGADKRSPVMNLSWLEAPNVEERSWATLAKDFMTKGGELSGNIELNRQTSNQSGGIDLIQDILDDTNLIGFARYFFGSMGRLDNLAMCGPMLHATTLPNAHAALTKGSSVVHAWGENGMSGNGANQALVDKLSQEQGANERFEWYRLSGELAGHASGNVHVLCGALARRAYRLGSQAA